MDIPPAPTNFLAFVPWVSRHLNVQPVPLITRVEQDDYYSQAKQRSMHQKVTVPSQVVTKLDENVESNTFVANPITNFNDICHIQAIYDKSNNLVQIKFLKNRNIPRAILKLISLALPFHKCMTAIHIRGGLHHDGLYEFAKIVTTFNITEVILDDTVLAEAKYYTLLEDNSFIKYLSLARCKLMDDEVKELASRLVYPSAASKTLSVLNLSSNKITDMGAKYLGDVLRINGQLAYLNLSGNMVTDTGADSIFNSLMKFPLTTDESSDQKMEYVTYLGRKLYFEKRNQDIQRSCIDKSQKKKINKSVPSSVIRSGRSALSLGAGGTNFEDTKSNISEVLEPYKHPHRSENTTVIGTVAYCLGNNTLCYLSLAYNNLSYLSVKKLYNVLDTQRRLKRSPKGLIKVCIDGNNIPESCQEMKEIDSIIMSGFGISIQSSNTSKKKAGSKSTPK